jgi:hypothetical protein
MEGGIFLFFIILLVPGLWLVFSFRREVKQRLWYEEQRRMEQKRATSISALGRSSRRSAPGHTRLPVEIALAELDRRGASSSEKTVSTGRSDVQRDSWQDLTVPIMGAAFESFLRQTSRPSEDITTSQVNEAFEKFLGERQHGLTV